MQQQAQKFKYICAGMFVAPYLSFSHQLITSCFSPSYARCLPHIVMSQLSVRSSYHESNCNPINLHQTTLLSIDQTQTATVKTK